MTHASLQSWLATGGFMLLGGVLYLFTRSKQPTVPEST
jgi:LPXTG-motif cell wall-anchored protein